MCTHLKNLFSFYMVKLLASVETIDVSECDSLEEIIEILVNYDKVEFPKLRSLTLQSLPSFTSFYTRVVGPSVPQLAEAQTIIRNHIQITIVEDKTPLFGELVEIPNLESLNLSSINIDKIWSDQPQSNVCFQNLTKLVVKDCFKLRYLCPLSVASSLKKLKGLFVTGCPKMEKIFETEGNTANKLCAFPKLEEIHLSGMNMLAEIWPAEASAADSFSSLISVHVERCEKLNKIFPSHMKGWFASLDILRVVNCKSVEEIFEIKDSQKIHGSGGIDTNLQHILVQKLPNLKQVWTTDPGGILNFKKLRSIQVFYCEKLRNVFPASTAKDVQKLETMVVHGCWGMVEIVASSGSETNNEPLVFPELTFMALYELSNIKCFYGGRHTIECPKLKRLVVDGCKKLQTFPTETSKITCDKEKPVFSAEKVIPKLEFMHIGYEEQNWLGRNVEKYRMHCLKELGLRSVKSVELLYQFLYRMPNLEKLNLTSSHMLEELVPSANTAPQERLGTVLQLKNLLLLSSGIKDLGFERDPVLQRLKLLTLRGCDKLINLAPSSVSLTYLVYLEVNFCRGLINLMATSTAKTLVQLKTMKVIRCKVKEIVTNEGNEEDKVIEIVFSKLITLELVALKYLTSFCSYKNCEFKFPSLEILIVRECPMMETFTMSHTRAPKLQNILAVEGEEKATWQWEGDLNATIQKVFNDKVSFIYTKYLNVSDNDNHEIVDQQLWQCNHLLVQQNNFHNLKRLNAYQCNSLVHVIPSHLLPCFENLEELEVRHCSAAQVIFNINDEIRETKALGINRLKKLSLAILPNLEHVWDKDPEGIIGLQVLQDMRVENCDCLKSLFPASVANDLNRLEVLLVTKCRELEEIFSKDEKAADGATKEFVFRCLTSLTLKELPGLKYFYPELHTLKWPVLEELYAFHCELVTLKCQEDHPEEQVLNQIEKVVQLPSLKKLSFDIGDATVTWDPESGQLIFHKLQRFQEESDSAPLYKFLYMLPIIEKLAFERCWFTEMFSAERPNADYTRILLHLKELELLSVHNLKAIGLEHSWIQPFPQNLQTLHIKFCSGLENLVPCTVSFSNLTHLKVSSCKSLQYLFTSSTAKSLARLKKIEIESCQSLQEIVSGEGVETHEDEQIVFQQLQVLYLQNLLQLRCFYPGNFALCFPSLEQVYVIDCCLMKTFSPANIIDHPTKWFSAKDATPEQECDLNSAARVKFEEKILKSAQHVSYLVLGDRPDLQEIWHGSLPILDLCFSNLHSLTVAGCQFLSNVLPFYLLPFLTELKTLEIRNCDFVKTIFDVKGITDQSNLPFALKELTLSKLPNLENVWNEDPHGILRMQPLQQVYVEECKCLTSVFPASVARDVVKLETLSVHDCEGLTAIVVEDNVDSRGTDEELTFPCMTSLELYGLPKLKYFYYCSIKCDILKTFTHLEPHTEDQVCIEKLTPNLKELVLGESEVKMIWHENFQGNLLHKLKGLGLVNFHVESDVFPYRFLQQLPNIEKLAVSESSFKDILCLQSPNVDDTGLLSQLQLLHLESLPELVSIGLENSWVEPFLKNLKALRLISCSRLRNLAPSPECVSNLMHLNASKCHGLVNLFTSSTAKSLTRLKTMKVKGCESIQEIVSNEGGESNEDQQIIFEKLQVLCLKKLHQLRCFYPGNFTLLFPSLKKVYVIDCSCMETFSPVNKIDHSTKWFSAKSATPKEECDLNLAVCRKFEEENSDASSAFDLSSSSSSDAFDEDSEHGDD